MNYRRILTEEEAYELLSFLVVSAERMTVEPHRYGPRRLLAAATQLIDAMMDSASGVERERLQWLRQELRTKDRLAMRDYPAYEAFLHDVTASLAQHLKQRELASEGSHPSGTQSEEQPAVPGEQQDGATGDECTD